MKEKSSICHFPNDTVEFLIIHITLLKNLNIFLKFLQWQI